MKQRRIYTTTTLILALLLMCTSSIYAQKKPKVNKAENALEDGELQEAKEIVDAAVEHEKTKDDVETYFVRGKVYEAIATSENPMIDQKKAVEEAVKSYNKVMNDFKNANYTFTSKQRIDAMYSVFMNQGAKAYEAENYEEAIKGFSLGRMISPQDTLAWLYSGVSAQQAEKYDEAQESYLKMIEMGIADKDVYNSAIYIARNINDNPQKALELVRKAKKTFPDERSFGKEEISILLALNKLDEAEAQLKEAVAAEPENANLHLNLAILYDNAHRAEMDKDSLNRKKLDEFFNKAAAEYEMTLELDPGNVVANFNYAVLMNDRANLFYKEVNAMDIKEYQKRGKGVEKKGNEYIRKGLPMIEKAYELAPNDIDIVSALQLFYQRLKMLDKLEEVSAKLRELEAAKGTGGAGK